MEFPTVMNGTIPFPILGLLGGIFHFYSNFKRTFCKRTVKNQFKTPLIWFCTVCRCPTKKTLGLYRLKLIFNRPVRLEFYVWPEVLSVGMRAASALITQWMQRLV